MLVDTEGVEALSMPRLARQLDAGVMTLYGYVRSKQELLDAVAMRHRDHRFEWTRAEFASWAQRVAEQRGYTVRFLPVGADDPEVGPPTQMAVFTRLDVARAVSS